MKSHFLRLAAYNQWANQQVIQSLLQQPGSDDVWAKLSHILLAESVWQERLQGGVPDVNIFAVLKPAEIQELAGKCASGWDSLIAARQDFNDIIAYKQLNGKESSSSVSDILTHVFNHGTYHRAQIATLMRQDEQNPVATDFIAFSRLFPPTHES